MPDLGNSTIFSQTDASNNSGTMPGWNGAALPSTIDDAGRALQGAITREWYRRNFTQTAGGTADAKTLTYTTAPAALYDGQEFSFLNNTVNTGAVTLNINGLGAKEIKAESGGAYVSLAAGAMPANRPVKVAYNQATDIFLWTNYAVLTTASTTDVLTGTDTAKFVTADALAALWEKGSNIASAATISVGEGGLFHVTGTTTITDIDFATDKTGRTAKLVFDGALTLTHNATTLILPGGANITTAANDCAIFVSEGTDAVRCVSYQRATGRATVGGKVIQMVYATDATMATGTTVMPFDDTIPQKTEGDQYMSVSITPTSATSILKIEFDGLFSSSNTGLEVVLALFQGTAADALAATAQTYGGSTWTGNNSLTHVMVAGTTSATTFKLRAGPSSAATLTFNGLTGARMLGGVSASSLRVTEIAP